MKFCDFHIHSTKSDGELSQAEVIELAIKNDIGVLAITDHNTPFDNLDELQVQFPEVKLINGSEISTSYVIPETGELREIHIIALDFQNTDRFLNLLQHNRFNSKKYVNNIIQKLHEVGVNADFTYDVLKAELNQELIGRMAIARKLVSLGLVSDIEEAFDEYIGDFGKRKAYVKANVGRYIPMDKAISEIIQANGIPILCHPYSYNFSEKQVIQLILNYKSYGGLAMETLYAAYTPEQRGQLKAYADEYGLLQSAGSDFHGRGAKNSLCNGFPMSIYYDMIKLQ